jgi:hypothetical protein
MTMPTTTTASAPPDRQQIEPTAEGMSKRRNHRSLRGCRRPSKPRVVAALTELAELAADPQTTRRLSSLARRVRNGASSRRSAARLDAELNRLIDGDSREGTDGLRQADAVLLLEGASHATAWRAGSRRPGDTDVLRGRLLLAAEAAGIALAGGDTTSCSFVLTVARLLADAPDAERLEKAVWDACRRDIERLVTPTGCVALDGSAAILARVGRWTRVRQVAAMTASAGSGWKRSFPRSVDRRWKQAVAMCLRLLGPRGEPVPQGSGSPVAAAVVRGITQAASLNGSSSVRRTMRLIDASGEPKRPSVGVLPHQLDDRPAAMALFRSGWRGRALRMLLDYRREQPHLELAIGRQMIVDGPWAWEIRCGGLPAVAEGPWQVTHLQDDDNDVTAMVITAPLSQGLQLERHLIAAHRDRVVILADAVVEASPGPAADLSLTMRLPLGSGMQADAADESRELTISSGRPRAVVMPLALPEWRGSPGDGDGRLDTDGRTIRLEQRSPVRRLFAPLWLDVSPGRFSKQITWRQLTVADTRIILRPSQAAAYRVQAHLTQWMLYRSLDEPRNRTVLGCNLSSVCRLGTLGEDGLVSQLVEW